jgi:hypothetical protein
MQRHKYNKSPQHPSDMSVHERSMALHYSLNAENQGKRDQGSARFPCAVLVKHLNAIKNATKWFC